MSLTAIRTGNKVYSVASESQPDTIYTVSLEFRSCTCPHFQHRCAGTKNVCKHLQAAQAVCELETAVKLQQVPDAEIADLYFRYKESRPEVAAVVLREIEARQAKLEAEHERRNVFA